MTGPLPVFVDVPPVLPPSAVLDSGTREHGPDDAVAAVARLVPLLATADIAYKKIDSLLRGTTVAELAACMRTGLWDTCVLCPAFPYQGRITRGGRQYARDATGVWSAITGDIVSALQAAGAAARHGDPAQPPGPGIAVFDAETDADLCAVANAGRAAGKVLWSGSGGLAQRHSSSPAIPIGSHSAPTIRHPCWTGCARAGLPWQASTCRPGCPVVMQPDGYGRASTSCSMTCRRPERCWLPVARPWPGCAARLGSPTWRCRAASCRACPTPSCAGGGGTASPSSRNPARSARPPC